MPSTSACASTSLNVFKFSQYTPSFPARLKLKAILATLFLATSSLINSFSRIAISPNLFSCALSLNIEINRFAPSNTQLFSESFNTSKFVSRAFIKPVASYFPRASAKSIILKSASLRGTSLFSSKSRIPGILSYFFAGNWYTIIKFNSDMKEL